MEHRERSRAKPAPPETIDRPRPVMEQVPPLPENPTEEQIAAHNARLEAAREKHAKELAAWHLEKQKIENRYANWLVEKNARESARESARRRKRSRRISQQDTYVIWLMVSTVLVTGVAIGLSYLVFERDWDIKLSEKSSDVRWPNRGSNPVFRF